MTVVTKVVPEFCKKRALCNSDFTIEWLLNSLSENDETFKADYSTRKIANVSARDISGGKGMFSIVLKCVLSFEDSIDENDVYTTILKIPGTDAWEAASQGMEKIEDMKFAGNPLIERIIGMHQTECDFYEIIGKHVSEILPRVHKTQEWKNGIHQGCLHMEDLSKRGTNLDYYNSLSHGQLKSIIKNLALFHKNIMCLGEESWKGKFLKQKRIFIDMSSTVEDFIKKFLEMSKKNAALQEIFDHPKIQKMVYNHKFIEYVYCQSHLDLGIPDMIVHGDLWSSNIIFVANEESGAATEKVSAFLDWQVVHEGNMLLDFVRLMLNCLDGDMRREAESYIFEFYVSELNQLLEPIGMKAPYSAEQVKAAYEYLFLAHFTHTVMMPGAILSVKPLKEGEERIHEARIDKCALRALNVFEDALALIETGKFDEWLQ